jgi:hypothetical protein
MPTSDDAGRCRLQRVRPDANRRSRFIDANNVVDTDKRDYPLVAYVQNDKVTASHAIGARAADRRRRRRPADQDVSGVGNNVLVRDLGAYEAQPIADRIFADAFGDRASLVH